MSGAAKRLLLVDGHAFAYRAFFAIRKLSSPSGAPTNAIFGFIKMMARVEAASQPTHEAVIWDGGLSEDRVRALPEYKAQRPEMPSDLAVQLDEIEAWLKAIGLVSLCQDGVEADDWIGVAARRAAAEDYDVVVASSDKDFMQLVSPRIGILNPGDKFEKVWTREEVAARTGVEPEQIVDWLALTGDSVDNIKGVPGVGTKTAASLLRQFGSIDELYRRTDEVASERLRVSLLGATEAVKRNRELVRLPEKLPVSASAAEWARRTPDRQELKKLYAQWGFRTLLKELDCAEEQQTQLF